jgi:hypothetical protein
VDEDTRRLHEDHVTVARSMLPAPVLTYVGPGNRWRLEQSYAYQDGPTTIEVPAGFMFDLASIPRIFWGLIAPFELSVAAPLLHDFLYQHRGDPPPGTLTPPRTYTRSEADTLFRTVMEQEGVPGWRRVLGYLAVRLFGFLAWRR